tara:strand:- start:313 stop:903 length:591 start_codon:yes stop_codon:yes gene_type:complete
MYISLFKPFLDKSFVVLIMPLILPIILVISILIVFFDGMPIFFIQERPGKDSKLFKLIKFRTMKDENNSSSSSMQRVTKLGQTLRKLSIDELPSLINVLLGDMSLIGPRPLLKEYLGLYDDNQKKRHNLLPGLTGLAQVEGRNSISWDEKFRYDLKYVERVNFFLDIRIFLKSFLIIFNQKIINQNKDLTMKRFDD